MSARRAARTMLAAAGLLAAAACDSGPGGPGTIVASVEGASLGGAVVEVRGLGIVGFEGLSGTQLYASPLPNVADAHRVLLIHPDGGELRFEIQVEDIGMEDPVLTVLSAAGVDNLTQLTAGIVTRVER